MAEQAWSSVESAGGEFGQAAPPPMPSAKAAYELRPLTTGELLDRTFFLYRSNFWLFVSLAAIASSVNTAVALVQVVYLHYITPQVANPARQLPGGAGLIFQSLGVFAFAIVAGVLYLAVYSVVHAATTSAVTSIYLGDPTSMKRSLNAVKGRWFRFILIGLWQIWSAMWLFFVLFIGGAMLIGVLAALMPADRAVAGGIGGVLLIVLSLGGMVYGVIAYIRNSFAVPAAVMEGMKVRKAMRRSKDLTKGTKGRIFLLYVFIMALYFVAVAIQSPLSIIILQKKTTQVLLVQAIGLFVGFFTGSVIGPVGAIGICLFYIDERIRKEGFDIEFLIERSGPVPVVPPPPMPMPEVLPGVISAQPVEAVINSVVENP